MVAGDDGDCVTKINFVRIASYLNITPEEIAACSRNIYIGISLGNKYFTREHVADYIQWAVLNTKDRVGVIIADTIHAINIEVFNDDTPARAMRRALRIGDEMSEMIRGIINELPSVDAARVTFARWNEVEAEPEFQRKLRCIMQEWKENSEFREYVLAVFREYAQARGGELTSEQVEYGCNYLLRELPTFLGGLQLHGVTYSLHPYPATTPFAKLTIAIQNGEMFSDLAEKLGLVDKIAIIEAYAE